MRPAGAREIAHDLLVRIERSDAFADVLLADRLAASALGPDDARLLTQLVYGTLAWQGRLDHHLRSLLRRPAERLDPAVRAALRIGLYQLLFLDRIPAYAAIDTSVALVQARHRTMRGLVNAVLRRVARDPAALALPPEEPTSERLAVEWSHPLWLVERWARGLPPQELRALLAADNAAAPTTLRVNPLRATPERVMAELAREGIRVAPARFAPGALVVERAGGAVHGLAAHREGRVSFQSEASQLVVDLLDPRPGMLVLDACAAPGAKTSAIAERIAPGGRVVALDPRASGLERLRAEAARLGVGGVEVVAGDARLPPLRGAFDAVLVDAPCSGLGTLRQHPELRWRRRPEDVPRLAALQRTLLTQVAPLVRPGGVLVYAVCTLTDEESEDVVQNLLSVEGRFGVEPGQAVLPAAAHALLDDRGRLRTSPARHGLDGFFAVRLRAH